jgi:hypothetical protein
VLAAMKTTWRIRTTVWRSSYGSTPRGQREVPQEGGKKLRVES